MKKNPIYSALSIILRNTGRTLQILKYGLMENGRLRMTDLDHEIKVFVGDHGSEPLLVDVGHSKTKSERMLPLTKCVDDDILSSGPALSEKAFFSV